MKCKFCDKELIEREALFRNNACVFLSGDGYYPKGVLEGSGVIIPFAHKATPFELSDEEWADTLDLLKKVKRYLDEKYHPDGYSLGWNVGKGSGQIVQHAHLHVMPRFMDEPMAGKGIRNHLKQADNARKSSQQSLS